MEMTTMQIDRAVVEQALGALSLALSDVDWREDSPTQPVIHKAHAALRAALAQQADPTDPGNDVDVLREHVRHLERRVRQLHAQQAEPVEPVAHRVVAGALFDFMGWLTSRRERLVLSSTDDAAPAADAIKDFAEMRGLSLNDAKVQDWNADPPQRQEPVAWIESPHGAIRANPNYKFTFPSQLLHWQIPLYIAPPRRKPLTEGEIMHIGMTHQSLRQVVRAVERAHGIGEQS